MYVYAEKYSIYLNTMTSQWVMYRCLRRKYYIYVSMNYAPLITMVTNEHYKMIMTENSRIMYNMR